MHRYPQPPHTGLIFVGPRGGSTVIRGQWGRCPSSPGRGGRACPQPMVGEARRPGGTYPPRAAIPSPAVGGPASSAPCRANGRAASCPARRLGARPAAASSRARRRQKEGQASGGGGLGVGGAVAAGVVGGAVGAGVVMAATTRAPSSTAPTPRVNGPDKTSHRTRKSSARRTTWRSGQTERRTTSRSGPAAPQDVGQWGLERRRAWDLRAANAAGDWTAGAAQTSGSGGANAGAWDLQGRKCGG